MSIKWQELFKMKFLVLACVVLISIVLNRQVESLELRYKVCTVEDLRRSVEQVCMRLGRDTNSLLSLGPYGSIASSLDNDAPLQVSEESLIEILKASKLYGSTRLRQGQQSRLPIKLASMQHNRKLFKRAQDSSTLQLCDYLDSCCNQSCVIDPEDLAPHCRTI